MTEMTVANLAARLDSLMGPGVDRSYTEIAEAILDEFSSFPVLPEHVEALAEWGYVNSNPPIADVIPWKRAYGPLRTFWRKKARAFLAEQACGSSGQEES